MKSILTVGIIFIILSGIIGLISVTPQTQKVALSPPVKTKTQAQLKHMWETQSLIILKKDTLIRNTEKNGKVVYINLIAYVNSSTGEVFLSTPRGKIFQKTAIGQAVLKKKWVAEQLIRGSGVSRYSRKVEQALYSAYQG